MRPYKIASQILILSISNFVLAAPVAVREINEVRVNAVDVAKVGTVASEKRMDPGDQFSTNAEYLETEWNTISSDSTASMSSDSDTATSRPTLPTGSQPGSPDDPPPHPGPADNPPSSHSVSTDAPPPSPPGPAGNPPPEQPGPAGNPPPPHSVPTTDHHSPPDAEPQEPGAPESENFFGKLLKDRFKRRISD